MYYFGLRSTPVYLQSLSEIRTTSTPHHLTSVIGGFAFLHALSLQTQSITIVDVDPDALTHWSLIGSLIVGADSLEEFRKLLSGLNPVKARQILSDDLYALYQQTYGTMVLNEDGSIGKIDDSTVFLGSSDLTPMTFSWHFGSFNFTDEKTFAMLQEVIRTRPIEAKVAELQHLDYGELSSAAAEHVVLASNCESPLFTKSDVIFEQVCRTSHLPTRYVSWIRDCQIFDRNQTPPQPFDLANIPYDDVWIVDFDKKLPKILQGQWKQHQSIKDYQALRELVVYGKELLVVIGGDSLEVINHIAAIAPSFKRVLWVECPMQENEISEAIGSKYLCTKVTDIEQAFLLELPGLRRDSN